MAQSLTKELQPKFIQSDPTIAGFDIGINQGSEADQTIFHCHIHLTQQRNGDIENPKGGIRNLMGLHFKLNTLSAPIIQYHGFWKLIHLSPINLTHNTFF